MIPLDDHGNHAKNHRVQDRDVLPDKYFVEGEAVVILHHLRGQQTGTVADAHVNWCPALALAIDFFWDDP